MNELMVETTVGAAIGEDVEDGEVELLTVVAVLDIGTDMFLCVNNVSPFGPPQISDELPPQVIVHRPSVARMLPANRALPQ